MAALAHALFEMSEVELGMVGRIPDQVVPIATLDAFFPTSAQNCVHLAGKQVRQCVGSYRKGDRLQKVTGVRLELRWRIRVNFQLDF